MSDNWVSPEPGTGKPTICSRCRKPTALRALFVEGAWYCGPCSAEVFGSRALTEDDVARVQATVENAMRMLKQADADQREKDGAK